MAHYKQLSKEERYTISAELKRGVFLREIAGLLPRSVSSRREIKRNTGLRGYRPRKTLNWLTPYQVLSGIVSVALQA